MVNNSSTLLYLLCCCVLRCTSPLSSAKSVIHLFTSQLVGLCDDDSSSLGSVTHFILHLMTSFLQHRLGDLTIVQVSGECCVYDDICLRGHKNKGGK